MNARNAVRRFYLRLRGRSDVFEESKTSESTPSSNSAKTNIGHIAKETDKAVMVNALCEVAGHDKPI